LFGYAYTPNIELNASAEAGTGTILAAVKISPAVIAIVGRIM